MTIVVFLHVNKQDHQLSSLELALRIQFTGKPTPKIPKSSEPTSLQTFVINYTSLVGSMGASHIGCACICCIVLFLPLPTGSVRTNYNHGPLAIIA